MKLKVPELAFGLSMLVTALVITHNAYALQLLGQQQIVQNLTIGQSTKISVMIYNDANSTFQSNATLTGNVTQIATLLNKTVTISPFDVGTIYLNATATEEGIWTGNLIVSTLKVPIKLSSKKFHSTAWYQSGQVLTIEPGDYKLNIQNITQTGAYIVTSQHGYVLQGKQYGIGDGLSLKDFGFKVLDIYQNIVKLEIISTYSSTTISVSKTQQQPSGLGGFSFYTTQYANTIEANSEIKEHFILRNGLNEPVILKKIEYSGTVITQEGRQPINAVQYQLGTLQPGEETTFVVDINTKGLSPGVWTPILTVKALTSSNRIVSASISFVLTVTKAVQSPSPTNLTITYPKKVVANKNFNITIKGLTSGMSVDMQPNEHLVGVNVSMSHGIWKWTGHLDVNETQQAVIYVKLLGGIFKTFKFNLTVPKPPEPIEIYAPNTVWVGDMFIVKTVPPTSIDINGTKYNTPANITLLLPGKYVIKASKEGYKPSETTIIVVSPVKANVTGKTVGSKVTVSFSSKGSYTVYYNGKPIVSTNTDKLTFTPTKTGIYAIKDNLGHTITSFEVKQGGFSFKIPKFNTDWIVYGLVVVLIVLIVLAFRKKKTKARNITIEGASSPLTLEPEGE